MKKILLLAFFLISFIGFSQNNYIVKTDDGRRVLLKADYTWEYIDITPPAQGQTPRVQKPLPPAPKPLNCGLTPFFKEPILNKKIQAALRKTRSTMPQLKKKVAKNNKCDIDQVILINVDETVAKGRYTFCVNGRRISYKRLGSSFFKKSLL